MDHLSLRLLTAFSRLSQQAGGFFCQHNDITLGRIVRDFNNERFGATGDSRTALRKKRYNLYENLTFIN